MIVASAGMLGSALVSACRARSIDAVGLRGPEDIDITDENSVRRAMADVRPTVLINAAAWTDVDGAEADPAGADLVNNVGARRLAEAAEAHGARFVHFSTDYVFDGTADTPWAVEALTGPINVYGRTKLDGETAVRAAATDHLMLRTSWLFAPTGRNFLLTMLTLMVQRESLSVVSDQFGRPTYAPDLADMTLRLLEAGASGTLHATNDGSCSWHEFAVAIRDAAGLECRIEPCTTGAFPRPAQRPTYSVLDLHALIELIGTPRHWSDAARSCVEEVRRHGGPTTP